MKTIFEEFDERFEYLDDKLPSNPTGSRKNYIKEFFQQKLESIKKEVVGEERNDVYAHEGIVEREIARKEGYNLKRQEVIETFKKFGI